ncbi:MAG TPA: hypothetical protein VHT53_10745 [Candidatus Elarobacter sp.]|jgi:hypothetical protein|nr:hypothetical protein [Candidatus Elarobacter sp.]
MTVPAAHDDRFAPALGVANAVLYEGYLLFPYTATSGKNRVRWQFGVVAPAAYAAGNTGETAEQQTEVLIALPPGSDANARVRLTVLLRFLHVEARRVLARGDDGAFAPVERLRAGGATHLTFDEAVEREVALSVDASPGASHSVPIAFGAGCEAEPLRDDAGTVVGRVDRERWPLLGTLCVACEAIPGEVALRKVRIVVRNASGVVAGERAGALRTAFVSAHALLAADGGAFVSVLDPPPSAVAATRTLANRHVFPVLIGGAAGDEQHAALMFSSPIILYDFPAVAPQTDADAFDATEIDELLSLSVLSLPDAEREEARATDPRARAIVERAERFGPQELARLHAGMLHRADAAPPLADPFDALDVPALDCVFVDGAKVAKGARVRLHPKRRADAWDMFLDGKDATVRAIHQDVEDVLYVAVTVDDDPASDLHDWYGRSFFFYPDEIEPVEAAR